MSIGTGIAIAGIWLGVVGIGYVHPSATILVALLAFIATIAAVVPDMLRHESKDSRP